MDARPLIVKRGKEKTIEELVKQLNRSGYICIAVKNVPYFMIFSLKTRRIYNAGLKGENEIDWKKSSLSSLFKGKKSVELMPICNITEYPMKARRGSYAVYNFLKRYLTPEESTKFLETLIEYGEKIHKFI